MRESRTRVVPLIHPLGYSAHARANTAVSTLAWFHREHRNRLATAGAFPVNTQGHFKTTLSADETAPACSRSRASCSKASPFHFLHTDPFPPWEFTRIIQGFHWVLPLQPPLERHSKHMLCFYQMEKIKICTSLRPSMAVGWIRYSIWQLIWIISFCWFNSGTPNGDKLPSNLG